MQLPVLSLKNRQLLALAAQALRQLLLLGCGCCQRLLRRSQRGLGLSKLLLQPGCGSCLLLQLLGKLLRFLFLHGFRLSQPGNLGDQLLAIALGLSQLLLRRLQLRLLLSQLALQLGDPLLRRRRLLLLLLAVLQHGLSLELRLLQRLFQFRSSGRALCQQHLLMLQLGLLLIQQSLAAVMLLTHVRRAFFSSSLGHFSLLQSGLQLRNPRLLLPGLLLRRSQLGLPRRSLALQFRQLLLQRRNLLLLHLAVLQQCLGFQLRLVLLLHLRSGLLLRSSQFCLSLLDLFRHLSSSNFLLLQLRLQGRDIVCLGLGRGKGLRLHVFLILPQLLQLSGQVLLGLLQVADRCLRQGELILALLQLLQKLSAGRVLAVLERIRLSLCTIQLSVESLDLRLVLHGGSLCQFRLPFRFALELGLQSLLFVQQGLRLCQFLAQPLRLLCRTSSRYGFFLCNRLFMRNKLLLLLRRPSCVPVFKIAVIARQGDVGQNADSDEKSGAV